MDLDRPAGLFDRDWEWGALRRFAADGRTPGLGVVYGRRRQGKSFLLSHLTSAAQGLYVLAQPYTRELGLRGFVDDIAAHAGFPAGISMSDWRQAMRFAVQALASTPSRLLVIDEFPYLLSHSPELPAVLQGLIDETRNVPGTTPFKLILCGSALSVMTELLSGTQPLRGRAVLDLKIEPFDYRTAARYWRADNPQVALFIDAIFGGTPGYRDLVRTPPPITTAGFGTWLEQHIFDPSHALFGETDYLLREDPRVSDRAMYQSLLAAISAGSTTPSKIARALGRPETSLAHPLTVLRESGFVRRVDDVLRKKGGASWELIDPIIRFQQLVMRPRMAQFEARRPALAWEAAQDTFSAQILGPHFARLCRQWATRFSEHEGLGEPPGPVGTALVSDPASRKQHQLDVVVLGSGETAGERASRVVMIGEAKATNEQRTLDDLRRLEHIRGLLVAQGTAAGRAKLALFSRTGFVEELLREAGRSDVLLIDLARLYGG